MFIQEGRGSDYATICFRATGFYPGQRKRLLNDTKVEELEKEVKKLKEELRKAKEEK